MSAPYLRLKNSKRTLKSQAFCTVPEKPKKMDQIGAPGGTLLDFLTSILLQNIKKIEGDNLKTYLKNFENLNAEKKLKGGLLYFSSLWQTVQFDTLKFHRAILVSSCTFKKVPIVAAFHFMKRRLKTAK